MKIRSHQLVAAVLATSLFTLALGARAEDDSTSTRAAECKSVQLSAWFERQRQLTDGDTNPYQAIPSARECAKKFTANATGGADDAERREKVAAVATKDSVVSGQ